MFKGVVMLSYVNKNKTGETAKYIYIIVYFTLNQQNYSTSDTFIFTNKEKKEKKLNDKFFPFSLILISLQLLIGVNTGVTHKMNENFFLDFYFLF